MFNTCCLEYRYLNFSYAVCNDIKFIYQIKKKRISFRNVIFAFLKKRLWFYEQFLIYLYSRHFYLNQFNVNVKVIEQSWLCRLISLFSFLFEIVFFFCYLLIYFIYRSFFFRSLIFSIWSMDPYIFKFIYCFRAYIRFYYLFLCIHLKSRKAISFTFNFFFSNEFDLLNIGNQIYTFLLNACKDI